MMITILYDNDPMVEDLRTGWGFSCHVETGALRVLFDTGWDGGALMHNAKRMDIDLSSVDVIFISHEHWDHLGGLARVLSIARDAKVFVPASISERLKEEISARATLVDVTGPQDIGEGITTTGEMGRGRVKEQSLLLRTDGGPAILTGCAHQGLENILEFGRCSGRPKALIGGFHGFDRIDELSDVERIFPCHCTIFKSEILARFPGKAERCGVGRSIVL